ncbi:MAG: hypothetical protein LUG16_06095 [Candidatus Gastranaerophilales bacterium]|nr:hypothetical protein [Candidatus Gastranaerophilales bacterium]
MRNKVLIVQLETITGDIKSNIEKVERLLEECPESESDLIVLPELWTCGWDCPNFNNYSQNIAVSDTLHALQKIAKKYKSNVIGGTSVLRKNNENDRNSCLILNRNGELKAVYDKYHLFSHRGQSEGLYLESGNSALLVNLDIGKVGISVCYDVRFPEMFRLYAFNEADFVVNMAAWPKSFIDEYVTLAKARAVENQIFFICSCLTGKINESFNFSGHSMVIDYKGRIINSLDYEEKVLCSDIDIAEMKQYRQQMPILKDTKQNYKLTEL